MAKYIAQTKQGKYQIIVTIGKDGKPQIKVYPPGTIANTAALLN